MRKILFVAAALTAVFIGGMYAMAQIIPGNVKLTSFANSFGLPTLGPGPQSTYLLVSGGTVTCTGGGTPSVSNTNVDAGSMIVLTLKTAGGTPAVPIITTITAGTGFSITCGGSDTSTYNYVVIG